MSGGKLEYVCMVFVGQKGTRKTDTMLRKFVMPTYTAQVKRQGHGNKVLIVAQERAWSHEQYGFNYTNSMDKLEQFCKGRSGVLIFLLQDLGKANINKVYTLIGQNFRKGTIILEDCTSYINSHAPASVQNIFINNKNFRANVFMSYHSIDTPKFVRENSTHFVLFKSISAIDENEQKYRRYYPSCYPTLYAAWKRVQEHPNNYYHETIPTGI